MANPIKRGESGSQVSSWNPTSSAASSLVSTIVPYGLTLQRTILTTGTVAIPDGVTFVYAIVVGGGGGGGAFNGGSNCGAGAGGVAWGWSLAVPTCVVGTGGVSQYSAGNYTRYGSIIAGGGAGGIVGGFGVLGSGAGGANTTAVNTGGTNYWGIPGSTTASGAGAGGAGGNTSSPVGGNGISGGGGYLTGNGGNGLAGGGGGNLANGGNGFNIATGVITTGGLSNATSSLGGGGAALQVKVARHP